MEKTAMIGFGCAGYHALRTMRQQGYQGEIHVYANVSHPPANPMLTTYYVAGRIPYEGMFPFGSLQGWPRSTRPSCIWIPMSCG